MYSLLAERALERQAAASIASQAESFSQSVSAVIRSHFRDLAILAETPELVSLLASPSTASAAGKARAQRALLALYPRGEGGSDAYAISATGVLVLGPPEPSTERVDLAGGSWGIQRLLRFTDRAVEARVAPLGGGGSSALSVGQAVRGDDGLVLGYLVADLPRRAIAEAALANGIIGGASLRSAAGKVVFDQSDPSREGSYEYEPESGARPGTPSDSLSGGAFEVLAYADPDGRPRLIARVEGAPGRNQDFRSSSRRLALMGLASATALAIALALEASRSVTRPVLGLARAMKDVERGNLEARAPRGNDDELGALCRSFDAMVDELARAAASEAESERLLREAELRSLAARTNPHFLHNTLASIKSLAKLDRAEEIALLVTRLGRILRAASASSDGMRSLGDSMAIARDYLEIERLRHGTRFDFALDLAKDSLPALLPSLTLEPLVENAITHGLERKTGAGRLSIASRREGDGIIVRIEDDGPGMKAGALEELNALLAGAAPTPAGRGMGLIGTNRRLRLAFGSDAGLRVESPPRGGFVVLLRAPFKEEA